MTAANARLRENQWDSPVGRVCQVAVDGRRATRALAQWAAPFQLSESELQILWRLHASTGQGVDQTTLATLLALSPAQVSACVEKLRGRELIVHQSDNGDRRRHLWQLSTNGCDVLHSIVVAAGESREAAA